MENQQKLMTAEELSEVVKAGIDGAKLGKSIYTLGKLILEEKETDQGKREAMLFFGILGAIVKRKEQTDSQRISQ